MTTPWIADPAANFLRRLGDQSSPPNRTCPDIWELDNGDFAIIGHDMTAEYSSRLPETVSLQETERLVVVPRLRLLSARKDLPDA
jgi:hypothetical protein